jgi:hypothetical protein
MNRAQWYDLLREKDIPYTRLSEMRLSSVAAVPATSQPAEGQQESKA